jgi:hypothetical protein
LLTRALTQRNNGNNRFYFNRLKAIEESRRMPQEPFHQSFLPLSAAANPAGKMAGAVKKLGLRVGKPRGPA